VNDYDGYGHQPESTPEDVLSNIDAEAALLGAMLLDNSLILEWADKIRVDDFAEPLHGRIYSACLKMTARGATANAINLRPIFAQDEAAQHGEYLGRLVESSVAVVGAKDFAEQIIDLSDRRVSRAAMQAAMECLENDFETPIVEIAARVETATWAQATRTEAKSSRTLRDMIDLSEERMARVQDRGEVIGAVNLLVPDFDKVIGPLESGTLNLLAGRPGMGKTTAAHSIALGYAANGNPGLYASAEMTDEQLAMRATVDLAFALGYKIKHDDLRKAKLTPAERQALKRIADRADIIPLDYEDMRGANIRRLWSAVSRKKALLAAQGKKLAFVVVDYIGLFEADIDGKLIDDDRKRTNFISKFLLKMAQTLDIAVIALCQLSRAVEARVVKKPNLADLRDSGNLEQDADSVTFVYREEYYLEQIEPKVGERDKGGVDLHEEWEAEMNAARGKIELIGGKNRHGPSVTRVAKFFGPYYAVRAADVFDVGFDDPLLV
jgi:replicative DNA helicase